MFRFLIFIFFVTIKCVDVLKSANCDGNIIDYCLECGKGIHTDKCVKCDNKTFSFVNGYFCRKCDEKIFGNIGCGGNCDGSNYEKLRNILCEENGCKEGYYNIDGICHQCSIGSSYCINCTYIAPSGSTIKQFKCLECLGGLRGEYRVLSDGKCHTCKMSHCKKCHYINDTNLSECEECEKDYYLDPKTKECNKCRPISMEDNRCISDI